MQRCFPIAPPTFGNCIPSEKSSPKQATNVSIKNREVEEGLARRSHPISLISCCAHHEAESCKLRCSLPLTGALPALVQDYFLYMRSPNRFSPRGPLLRCLFPPVTLHQSPLTNHVLTERCGPRKAGQVSPNFSHLGSSGLTSGARSWNERREGPHGNCLGMKKPARKRRHRAADLARLANQEEKSEEAPH
jgi:hypothetical protein